VARQSRAKAGNGTWKDEARPDCPSPALLDAHHPSTLIIPLTAVLIEGAEPLRIRVRAAGRLRRTSDLLIDQLRAIDNRRLVQGPMTTLSAALMIRVHEALSEILDLDQVRENLRHRDCTPV